MVRGWTRILPQLMAGVLFAVAAEGAVAADWSVAQMSGKVAISTRGAQPVALTKGEVLPSGGILTTGPASRALLVRSEETMVVGANAAIAIPPGSNNRQFTTVLEKAGLVEFTVEKQNVQHFSVETPYLAAVVKGTQFTVEVTPTGGTVRVTRGVVEVTALASGYVTSLTAGQSAIVKADGTLALAGAGPRPTVYQGTPRAPIVDQQFASIQQPGGSGNGGSGNGGGLFARLFGGPGGVGVNVNAGPASVEANLGDSGLNAGIALGGASVNASVGGNGANVTAALGGIDADVNVGDEGLNVNASVGGLSAGASVTGGGVQVETSVSSVSAGGGGVQVDAGPVSVDVGGGGGIDIDVGGLHIGLGGR